MATLALPPDPVPNAGDDLDAILSVDADLGDLFAPMRATIDDIPPNTQPSSQKRPRPNETDELGLGITEEIQVSKKRKPAAKLDEERLLSQAGIPKLRKITKQRLKFKGKGHEFSDVMRVLNLYQLWLDDLFPKAKFADGLGMIEKLGHTKRMGVMRREWVKEGEGRVEAIADSLDGGRKEKEQTRDAILNEESLFVGGDGVQGDEVVEDLLPEDDDLDALIAESIPDRTIGGVIQKPRAESHPPDDIQQLGNFEDQYSEEMRMMADMETW